MARKPKETTKDAENETCPKCGGTGLILDDQGNVSPCACGTWEDLQIQHRLDLARIPKRFSRKTLAGFRPETPELAKIKEAARAYALGFTGDEEKGLILRGGTGVGKTHVAVGILIEVIRRGYTGMYWNFSELLTMLRSSYGQASELSEMDILSEIEQVDLLVLDDLGAEAFPSEWVRDRLYLIINRRYENLKAVIITTNLTDDIELNERVTPRILSRIHEMCDRFVPFPDQDYRIAHMH